MYRFVNFVVNRYKLYKIIFFSKNVRVEKNCIILFLNIFIIYKSKIVIVIFSKLTKNAFKISNALNLTIFSVAPPDNRDL